MIKSNWVLWLYLLITLSIVYCFMGPIHLEKTTWGIIVGTIVTTVGAVIIAAPPAYLVSLTLAKIIVLPPMLQKWVSFTAYILAGMPSIILGIIGFLIFCSALGLGWSMLSAMLTLILLLYPTLVVAFSQMLRPMQNRFGALSRSLDVGPLEFSFRIIPSCNKARFLGILVLGWATALSDTAAVMLTCGALTGFPESLFDSVRILNYHIYLQAMEVPGGMPEARTLSLFLVLALIVLLAVPRILVEKYSTVTGR